MGLSLAMIRHFHLRATVAALLAFPLSACLGTVADVVTAPVRVAGKAIDLATTSQSEADAKRGREMRKRDERLGKLDRKLERETRRCQKGVDDACREADELQAEIAALSRRY